MLTSAKAITEVEPNVFVCDASDLYDQVPDFRTGWPPVIYTRLGNGQALLRCGKKVNAEGEIIRVQYKQNFGCLRLAVYND